MNKHPIHQSDEEKLITSSESSGDTLREHSRQLEEVGKNTKETNQKIGEIKSASLITNKLLKDIKEKDSSKMELTNKPHELATAFYSMLRGDKGDSPTTEELVKLITPLIPKVSDGYTPKKGKDYFDGEPGTTPKKGKDYFTSKEISSFKKEITPIKGVHYDDGKPGYTPVKGIDYKDGSPDSPDEVIEKVNSSKKLVNAERVRGLVNLYQQVERIGSSPMGKEAGGGGNVIRFLSNGVLVSAYVTEINFSTNITPVYDGNGRITLTASGGGGTTYSETPTGAVNGSNKTYTTLHTVTTVINFAINGQFIHPAEYSAVGTTITFITALDSSLSGTGFTIIYQ